MIGISSNTCIDLLFVISIGNQIFCLGVPLAYLLETTAENFHELQDCLDERLLLTLATFIPLDVTVSLRAIFAKIHKCISLKQNPFTKTKDYHTWSLFENPISFYFFSTQTPNRCIHFSD